MTKIVCYIYNFLYLTLWKVEFYHFEDALDVYWYVTTGKDNPKKECIEMLKDYIGIMRQLPRWNK